SPLYPFAYAFEVLHVRQPTKFWGTLFLSHFVGWLLLGLATHAISSRWQDSGTITEGAASGTGNPYSRWAPEANTAVTRRAFHATGAVELLLGNASVTRWILYAALGGWFIAVMLHWGSRSQGGVTFAGAKVCAFFFKMLAAIQACKFFSESR